MQANLELGLKGAYEGLSAVVIPAICDTLRCMTQNWRFGVTSIPMIPIVYPQNRTSPASVDYLISEFESVLAVSYTHLDVYKRQSLPLDFSRFIRKFFFFFAGSATLARILLYLQGKGD